MFRQLSGANIQTSTTPTRIFGRFGSTWPNARRKPSGRLCEPPGGVANGAIQRRTARVRAYGWSPIGGNCRSADSSAPNPVPRRSAEQIYRSSRSGKSATIRGPFGSHALISGLRSPARCVFDQYGVLINSAFRQFRRRPGERFAPVACPFRRTGTVVHWRLG